LLVTASIADCTHLTRYLSKRRGCRWRLTLTTLIRQKVRH